MISVISRKYGNGDTCLLSVRVKTDSINSAVALGITVTSSRWQSVQETLKSVRTAYRRGNTIIIDDNLTARLWELQKKLIVMDKAKTITHVLIAKTVREVLHQDEIKELERSNEEKARQAIKTISRQKPTLNQFIEQYISDMISGVRLKRRSTDKMSKQYIMSYKCFYNLFKLYQNHRNKVCDWDDMTLDLYYDFKSWMLEDKQYSANSVAIRIRTLKILLNSARELKLTTTDDFLSSRWSVDSEESDNIYIPTYRIKQLYKLDITNRSDIISRINDISDDDISKEKRQDLLDYVKSDRHLLSWQRSRDIFILACLSGQRVSDFLRINKNMIVTLKGRKFIYLTQKKTGKEVYIPLNFTINSILNKYETLKIDEQKLVKDVRNIALILGWTEDAGISEKKGLMEYPSRKKFYECIKTHTARRSFATNSYKAGISLPAIMAVTGHTTEHMLRKYLKLDSKERAIMAAVEFDKYKDAL